jgi:hypothetical protein
MGFIPSASQMYCTNTIVLFYKVRYFTRAARHRIQLRLSHHF